MEIKNLIDEDFCNYKKPAMFIGMPKCTFKCDKECGEQVCQNSELATAPNIEIDNPGEIVIRYFQNPITEAVVFGGLEPFDSYEDLTQLLSLFACGSQSNYAQTKGMPDIVIYTGYEPEEIMEKLAPYGVLTSFGGEFIIKFGRFIPRRPHRFDELLGVELASDNQYAVRLEDILNDKFNHIR